MPNQKPTLNDTSKSWIGRTETIPRMFPNGSNELHDFNDSSSPLSGYPLEFPHISSSLSPYMALFEVPAIQDQKIIDTGREKW